MPAEDDFDIYGGEDDYGGGIGPDVSKRIMSWGFLLMY